MKMKLKDFDAKLSEYAVTKFIPSVTSPATRFLLGMAAGAGAVKLENLGRPALEMLGVLAEEEVDPDIAKRAVKAGFDAAKGPLPVNRFGIGNLERSDADAFFSWLEPPQPAPAA